MFDQTLNISIYFKNVDDTVLHQLVLETDMSSSKKFLEQNYQKTVSDSIWKNTHVKFHELLSSIVFWASLYTHTRLNFQSSERP